MPVERSWHRRSGSTLVPDDDRRPASSATSERAAPSGSASPTGRSGSLAVSDFTDPLVPTEWWRAAIGVDTLTPPPAGRAVTIVDSGIDVTHPEFLGRANTETLNAQEPAGIGGEHGTAVGSLVAAPANGVGLVGIYPEALFRSWDAAKGQGTQLATSEIVQGILAAANDGPGIINLSLGSDDSELAIEQAIYEAVAKGTLIVAASGNDGRPAEPARVSREHPARAHGRGERSRERDRRVLEPVALRRPRRARRRRSRSRRAIGKGWSERRRDELRGARSSRVRARGSGRFARSSTRRSCSR